MDVGGVGSGEGGGEGEVAVEAKEGEEIIKVSERKEVELNVVVDEV